VTEDWDELRTFLRRHVTEDGDELRAFLNWAISLTIPSIEDGKY
jgi:hypothetical protein